MSTTMNVAGVRARLPTAGTARSSIAAPLRVHRSTRAARHLRRCASTTTRARMGGVMDVTKVGEVAGNAAVAVVEVSKAVRMRGV